MTRSYDGSTVKLAASERLVLGLAYAALLGLNTWALSQIVTLKEDVAALKSWRDTTSFPGSGYGLPR